jgi:hypothetical protein
LSDKGWIGFSRSPHSDAVFSGEIIFDGHNVSGDPLGSGVQGHNCGYRHRTYWRWMHAYFPGPKGSASTLEALVYDLPLGLVFRKAIWWHNAKPILLHRIQEKEIVNVPVQLKWSFVGMAKTLGILEASIEAAPPELHRLPYLKTDCSGTFHVANASLARAVVRFGINGGEMFETEAGAVLEMGGS